MIKKENPTSRDCSIPFEALVGAVELVQHINAEKDTEDTKKEKYIGHEEDLRENSVYDALYSMSMYVCVFFVFSLSLLCLSSFSFSRLYLSSILFPLSSSTYLHQLFFCARGNHWHSHFPSCPNFLFTY